MKISKREYPDIELVAFDLVNSHTTLGGHASIRNNTYRFDEVNLQEGDVFVDIGANVGLVSMYAARHFGAEVHAFECCPINFRLLNLNILQNRVMVYANSFGVSDETKAATINLDVNNTGGSSLYKSGEDTIKQNAYLLDFEIAMDPFAKIKYLKMDIEGSEFDIFKKLIKNKSRFFERVEFFHLEVHDLVEDFEKQESEIKDYLDTFPNLTTFFLR